MAPSKDDRVADAVERLIAHLIPADPREDEGVVQERHDYCFELVKSILEKCDTLYPPSVGLPMANKRAHVAPSHRRCPPTSTMRPT